MRNAIRDFLDLENVPTWRELGDGLAAAVALVVITAAIYLGGVAMGAHP